MSEGSAFKVRFVMLKECDESTPDRISITFPNDDREQQYAAGFHSNPVKLTPGQASECWAEIQRAINRYSGKE